MHAHACRVVFPVRDKLASTCDRRSAGLLSVLLKTFIFLKHSILIFNPNRVTKHKVAGTINRVGWDKTQSLGTKHKLRWDKTQWSICPPGIHSRLIKHLFQSWSLEKRVPAGQANDAQPAGVPKLKVEAVGSTAVFPYLFLRTPVLAHLGSGVIECDQIGILVAFGKNWSPQRILGCRFLI